MNKALWGVFFFIFSVDAKNVDFKLEAVPLPKAISLIYDEVLQKPYMLDPNLANDLSLMSFHATEKQDFNQFIIRYFENMNIRVYEKQGVVYLVKVKPPEPKVIKQSFVYNPIHRDVDYLQGFLKSEGEIAANGDKLVFYGTKEEIVRVQRVFVNAN